MGDAVHARHLAAGSTPLLHPPPPPRTHSAPAVHATQPAATSVLRAPPPRPPSRARLSGPGPTGLVRSRRSSRRRRERRSGAAIAPMLLARVPPVSGSAPLTSRATRARG